MSSLFFSCLGRQLPAAASPGGGSGTEPSGAERGSLVFADGVPRNAEARRMPLTPLDNSQILQCINPKAFWIPSGLDPRLLQQALSLVLIDYPLLSGRIGGGKGSLRQLRQCLCCYISVCNAGAEFVSCSDALGRSMRDFPLGAMARSGFSHMGKEAVLPDFFLPMSIEGVLEAREPLLKVKLTQLADGASILALTLHHAVLGATSFPTLPASR
jgi:hypothetical protein